MVLTAQVETIAKSQLNSVRIRK